ncbi:MAG: hypothetical protein A2X46_08275 [Lentisphaerae bacterium GWF2_57_35]|nr:MAG: hypothetical protein A2X46_08275 [Lentisphaerae bacterium GWF2_57_35]
MNKKQSGMAVKHVHRFFQGLEKAAERFSILGKRLIGLSKHWNHVPIPVHSLVMALSLGSFFMPSAYGATVFWRSEASNGDWDSGQGCGEFGTPASPWWYSGWTGNESRGRPDCWGNHQLYFGNNDHLTMTLNGGWFAANQIIFQPAASSTRTFGSNGVNMNDAGAKIENGSSANHVFNCQVALNVATEINPVTGDMGFHNSIFNNGYWINVYGNSNKTLTIGGVLDQGGGLAVKQNASVILTNNNTFSGAIWIEKGLVQLGGHTNAMGVSGIVNVGTNATLELNYGAATLRPTTLTLFGTGTNETAGALRKTSASRTVWPGDITLGADSRVVVTGGGLDTRGTIAAGAYTLYVTNSIDVNMTAGSMTGSKTTGDGALHKSGSASFLLRPDASLAGNITLNQGTIRIATGTMSGGGVFSMADGTILQSDGGSGRTMSKPMTINGHVTLGAASTYNGPLSITNTVNLNSGVRTIGCPNTNTISGVISSGGLNKDGVGMLILSAVNTYDSATIVSNGILRISNTWGLGGFGGDTEVRSGAALELTGGIATPGGESLTLAGAGIGSGGALRNISGDNSFNGAITLTASSRINSDSGTLQLGADADISGAGLGLTVGGAGIVDIWGDLPTGTATLTKDGSGTLKLNNFAATRTWSGLTAISEGTLELTAANGISDDSAVAISSGATLNMAAGNDTVGSIAGAGSIVLGNSTLTAGGDDTSTLFSGVISGAGGALTKQGTGALTLTAANTHGGNTTVSAGSLIQNGTNTSSAVTVSAGAFLFGVGSAGGLTVSGTVGPGTNTIGIGPLAVASLTLNNGSAFRCQLGNFDDTTDRDFISNSGAATINASATVYVDSSLLSNWDNTQTKSWNIVVGGISSADNLVLDSTTYWDDGSYPMGGGSFSLSADGGNLVLTFAPTAAAVPDVIVLGTNMGAIAHGDATPSILDGTDFGSLTVDGGTLAHSFTITNSGAAALMITNVAIGGAHATNFIVIEQPQTFAVSNMLTNADWEQGDANWNWYGGTALDHENRETYNGVNCRRGTNMINMWWQHGLVHDIPVTPGSSYTFSVWAVTPSGDALNGDVHGEVKVEWYDSGWTPLTSSVTKTWAPSGYDVAVTVGEWIRISIDDRVAPVNAAWAKAVVGTWGSAGGGRVIYDDAQFFRTPGAGGMTTFKIRFDPSAAGTRTATAYITNNVAGKTPYTFALQGTGVTPEIVVSCDAVDIADGAAPGYDFGTLGVVNDSLTKSFVVANSGTEALTVGAVTTSGVDAADFVIVSSPTSPVPAGGSTLFQVRFDPSASGARNAAISFANNDSSENPFNFGLAGTGAAAGITNCPATLSLSAMVGSSPAAVGYGVTNIGRGTLNYEISTNAGWVIVFPVSGSLAAGAGQFHMVSIDSLGLSAGSYSAIITNADPAASNSPQTVAVSLTVTNIPDPTVVSAVADGAQMVRLAWTKNAGFDVMIVHRTGAAPGAPSQNVFYNVGDPCGSGTIIYKGSGASLEHIVASGQTHHYAFYSINNNAYYSPGVSASEAVGSYRADEIVESFAYTNDMPLLNLNGGSGWNSAWYGGDASSFTAVVNEATGEPTFANMTSYPSRVGNRIKLTNPGNGGMKSAARSFPAITSGKLYVSAMIGYAYDGASKWIGLGLASNGTDKLFLGEVGSADHKFGISDYGGGQTSAFDLNPWSAGNAASTGNTYLIVGRYDFATRVFNGSVYYRTNAVPTTEPASWEVTDTLAAGYMNGVDALLIKAGCSDGGATIGDCYFDEIRVATNWDELIGITRPVATNYSVYGYGPNQVYDGQATGGQFSVSMDFYDSSGMGENADFDIFNPGGIEILTNQQFASQTYLNNGLTLIASNASHAGYYPGDLGTYTGRFSAVNSNGIWAIDSSTCSFGVPLPMTFAVADDDTVDPALTALSPLKLLIGSTSYAGSDATTNAVFYVNAADLTAVGVGNPFRLSFAAYDLGSGLSCGSNASSYQVNVDIETAITDDTTHYQEHESSPYASTFSDGATSVWKWTSFSAAELAALTNVGTKKISATIYDGDNDRSGDRSYRINHQFGFLVVTSPAAGSAKVIYDGFASAAGSLSGGGGGAGWSNNWTLGGDPFADYAAGSFNAGYSSYPDPTGNKIVLYGDVNGRWVSATRTFDRAFTTGRVYFSYMMNYANNGNNKYAGIKLMADDVEVAFIGKVSGADKALGVVDAADNRISGYTLENGSGNDYIVAGVYDFSTRALNANAYKVSSDGSCEMVAEETRGYWNLTTTQTVGQIPKLTGIRLIAGSINGGEQVGYVYYDEVRVGTNWFEVTRKDGELYADEEATGPQVELIYIGTNYVEGLYDTQVTDAELANLSDQLDFAVRWTSSFGVFLTNNPNTFNIGSRSGQVCPNWDPLTKGASTNSLGMDSNFPSFYGYNGALVATAYVATAFSITNSQMGDKYFITVSGQNNNDAGGVITAPNGLAAVPVRRGITVNSNLEFYVIDDDIEMPRADSQISASSTNLLVNGGFEGSTNPTPWWIYEVSPGYGGSEVAPWAQRSGTNGIAFRAWDNLAYGGFGQNVDVDLANGNTFTFSIWGKADTDYASSSGETWLKLEFWTNSSDIAYSIYWDVYDVLINNRGQWIRFSVTHANKQPGITIVKPVIGGGSWVAGGPGGYSAAWDDATLVQDAPLNVFLGSSKKSDDIQSITTLTDGELASATAGNPLKFSIGAFDSYSGLARTDVAAGAATNTSLTIENFVVANVTNYDAALSSADSRGETATNVWKFTSFGLPEIDILYAAGTNAITVFLQDLDSDRTGDRLTSISNLTVGYMAVVDDDTVYPTVDVTNNLLQNVGFEIGEGVNIPSWNPWEHAYAVGRAAYSGTNGVEFTSPGWGNIWQGVAATPSNRYTLSYQVRKVSPSLALDIVYMKIEFHDVDLPATSLIMAHETNILAALSTNWQLFTFSSVAVPGARHVRASIGAGEWSGYSQVTTVQVDSVTLTESPYPLSIRLGSGAPLSFSVTNNSGLFALTDGNLAGIDSGSPLNFIFRGYDNNGSELSGLSRSSTAGSDGNNMNVSIAYLAADNVTNYVSALSSDLAGSRSDNATSVWSFVKVGGDVIQQLMDGGIANQIQGTLRDADADRSGDQLSVSNFSYGYLSVTDDDIVGPEISGTGGYLLFNNKSGTATPVTDGDLANNLTITTRVKDAFSGVYGTTSNQFWLYKPSGLWFGPSNWIATPAEGSPQGSYLASQTLGVQVTVPYDDRVLGVWTCRIAVTDFDVDRIGDGMTTVSNMTFTVVDDDSAAPEVGQIDSAFTYVTNAQYLHVTLNQTNKYTSGASTSRIFTVTDTELATLSASSILRLSIGARDAFSGLARTSSAGASTNAYMSLSIGNVVLGNITNFYADESSSLADTINGTRASTNVWRFETPFTSEQISSLTVAGTNPVVVMIPDADNDRTNDASVLFAQQIGYLVVVDGDQASPAVSNLVVMIGDAVAPLISGENTTNVIYRISDGDLAQAGTTPISLSFNVYDPASGIPRNNVGADTNMNVSVDVLAANNVANYIPPPVSTMDTKANNSTSLWTWSSSFDEGSVSNLYGEDWIVLGGGKGNATGSYRKVRANIPDDDNTYPGDINWRSNQQFGTIWVSDDDTNGPLFGVGAPGNLLRNGDFELGSERDQYGAYHWEYDDPDVHGGRWGTATRRTDYTGGGYPDSSDENVGTIGGTWSGGATSGGWWQDVPAMTNQTYEAGAWFWNDTGTYSPAFTALYCEVKMEFYNASGGLLSLFTNIFYTPGESWAWHSVTGTAPSTAFRIRTVFTAIDVGPNGAMRVDDTSLRIKSVTNLAMDVSIGQRSAYVTTENSFYGFGSSTSAVFWLTDGDLAMVDETNVLKIMFNVYDPTSGVMRSVVDEELNYDIGAIGTLQDIHETYLSDWSAAETKSVSSTSAFVHVSNFTIGGYHNGTTFVETGEVAQLIAAGTNAVIVSAPNDDRDRGLVDREWTINYQGGLFMVTDDDAEAPSPSWLYVGDDYTPGALNTSNTVTDAQMTNGLDFAYRLYDRSGLFITNNNAVTNFDGNLGNISPNWDLSSPSGALVVENVIHSSTNIFTPSGTESYVATAVEYNVSAVTYANNATGTWTLQISAQDQDQDRGWVPMPNGTTVSLDRAAASDVPLAFTVVDDDQAPPLKRTFDDSSWGVGMGVNYFIVATNGIIVTSRSGSSTNVNFTVTDGYIANLSPAHNLQFVFGVLDLNNGLSRALDGTDTNAFMNFSIGSVLSGVITGYDETASSANTPNAVMTNVWTFNDNTVFTRDVISNLVFTAGISNRVTVTAPDADNDRVNDRQTLYSDSVGWFSVIDDDTAGPVLSRVRFNGVTNNVTDGSLASDGFSLTGLVQDIKGVLGTNYPTLQLFNPLTPLSGTQYMTNPLIADGSGLAPTPTSIGRTNLPIAFDDRVLGAWTAIVYVADADNDGWGSGDRTSTTTNYVFQVIDDDVYAPNIIGAKLGTGSGSIGAADLIISEYIEGSSFNKYIEIFNGTDSSVDMTNYSLAVYFNGATTPTGVENPIPLAGILMPGAVYIVAHSSASGWSGVPNKVHPQCSFNGDDAVALLHSGATVDVVGVIGSTLYPGSDVTLVRKASVLNPTTAYDEDEWDVYPMDTFSIMGSHVGPVTDGDLRSGALAITGHVQDASGIYIAQNAPIYSIFSDQGVEGVSAEAFSQHPAANGDATSPEPLADLVPVFPYADLTLGTYTARIVTVDYDVDRAQDSITGFSDVVFAVIDDDTNTPVVGSSVGTRLRNSSFEIQGSSDRKAYAWDAGVPDGNGNWWGTASRESWRAKSGAYEMALNAWSQGTNAGIWQQVANTTPPGTIWNLSAWFWSDDGVAGGAGLYVWTSTVSEIKIEFFDSDFSLLDSVSQSFPEPGETWTQVSVSRAAPADAAWARAIVAAWDMGSSGSALGGALQLDDVMFGPTPPLAVKIGSSFVAGSDNTSNAVFTMLDAEVGTNSLSLLFGAYDPKSGLSRGTSSATTQMNVSVDGLAVNNVDRYVAGESSANSTSEGAVSVWKWDALSGVQINALIAAGSNQVLATVFDADDDRAGDRLAISDQQYGYLKIVDDDTNAPLARDLQLKNHEQIYDGDIRFGLWNISMIVEDYSEVSMNSLDGYFAPNYSLVNSGGQTVQTQIGWIYWNKMVDSNVWSLGRATPGVAYADVTTGLYSVVWSATDKDNDRPGDPMQAMHSTNFLNSTNVFMVIDDDVDIPTSPSNIVLTPFGWTNVNHFVLAFDPARDASGIFEYRVSTNTAEPTLVVDGEPLPATYVTSSVPVSISNASFEVGSDELSMPYDPLSTNNWRSFSSDGAYLNFAGDVGGEEGVLASRHILGAGTLFDGAPRYTLCSQDVYLYNSNRLRPYIVFNGYFLGNLSHVGADGNYGAAFLKAEGFNAASSRTWIVANEWNEDHNGAPLVGVNASIWTQAVLTVTNASADTEFIRFSCGLSGHSSQMAYTGFWDNLSATVSVQTIGGVIYTNAPSGITTNWFFAIDDDNDRVSDRLKGPNTNFVIMYDGIAPTQIMNVVASPGLVDDTSEIDLTWSKPRDGGGRDSDPLSPWWSYKIYYTDNGADPTTNSSHFTFADNPALSNRLTESLTLSNFIFGVEYNIAIAGIDAAGNEGPMSAPTNVLLSGFFVTQGVANATTDLGKVDIAWTASENREYDLIYADAADFSASLSNRWKLVERGVASLLSDTGNVAEGRAAPLNLGNNMRFYRAAQKGRWQTNLTRRVASEEIYVLKAIKLYPGRNWIAFPGVPDTCTAARVFGHSLPRGSSAALSTRVSWYSRGSTAIATQTIWLSDSPLRWQVGNQDADEVLVPLQEGVVVDIPSNLTVQTTLFIGRVPTNICKQSIKGGTAVSPAYNLTAFAAPRNVHPSQMNLLESGFKGGGRPSQSDKLMKYDRVNQQISGAGIWYKTADSTWREASGINGAVIGYNYFTPDDGLVILTVHTNDWEWTNKVLYTLPTRYMDP